MRYPRRREKPVRLRETVDAVTEVGDICIPRKRNGRHYVMPLHADTQLLRFRATNVHPFPFEWVDFEQTAKEYGALLVRISREYDRRFP